jgi:LSD1 subclass zinc finger protein
MPLYVYDCIDCKESINIRHAYGAKNIRCTKCNSANLKKNLSSVLQLSKKCYNIKDKVGNEVNKAISEGKEELDNFKKQRKNRVYKDK